MNWEESKKYGDIFNGQFTIYCNHGNGWKDAKESGGKYADLGFDYEHFDKANNGATSINLKEAKEVYEKIGEYIDYMETTKQ